MAQEGNELETSDVYEVELSPDAAATDAEFGDAADATEDTQEIRGQIEATRQQMGETIDAIQERLSVANLSEQVSEQVSNAVESAKSAVYDATIGKAADLLKDVGEKMSKSNVLKTAQSNPIPLALIGIGTAWLIIRSRSSNSGYRNVGRTTSQGRDLASASGGNVVKGPTGTISGAAGTAIDGVSSSVSSVYHGAGQAAGQVYNKVGDLGSTAREQYSHYMEENPLAVGAVALALGAAVGFALPSTRYEGELMGSTREQLLTKAQDTASELMERTKETVRDAAASATEQG
ncbi:MAG: DUF3618 domain-containing protein [Pyrinomonadaceae bacterium]